MARREEIFQNGDTFSSRHVGGDRENCGEMATSTVEDYLKALMRISDENEGRITVGAVAAELSLTPGTVTAMMKHLSQEEYIKYEPRRSVALLPKGRAHALQVVRRHRLIETFLVEVIGLDWAEVHEEAEILEHVVSERLLAKIDEMLGHPTKDPHGDPIPNAAGEIAEVENYSLADVGPGDFRLARVASEDASFLAWLSENGLKPGCGLTFLSRKKAAGVTEIQVHGQEKPLQLGREAEASLQVVKCK